MNGYLNDSGPEQQPTREQVIYAGSQPPPYSYQIRNSGGQTPPLCLYSPPGNCDAEVKKHCLTSSTFIKNGVSTLTWVCDLSIWLMLVVLLILDQRRADHQEVT